MPLSATPILIQQETPQTGSRKTCRTRFLPAAPAEFSGLSVRADSLSGEILTRVVPLGEGIVMDVVILGGGGHGRVVLDILQQGKKFKPVGFLDNNKALHGRRVDGLPVLGGIESLADVRSHGVRGAVVAVGDNGVRRALGDAVEQGDLELVSAIHPSAQLASNASVGKGVVIAAGALVCAHCQIGDYVILNTGCIVDHESMIGTSVHICPGVRLAGHVVVEAGAHIGIGATVVQNVRVGFEAIVGAGAVVIQDVDPMTTVVGVPARAIKDAPNAAEFTAMLSPARSIDPRDPMRVPGR